MMKTRTCLALTALVLAAAWSCGKDDPPAPVPSGEVPVAITLSTDSFEVERAGGDLALTVTAPQRPRITGLPSWITVGDGTYSQYRITFTLRVASFGEYGTRLATLTVTAGELSATLTVTQQGRVKVEVPETDITRTLATGGATAEAQALYDYFLSLYGTRCVSSVVAHVNWNHAEADRIYAVTGRYPAVNCYDFIQIYVPKNNWIDYTDLTPVTEWAEAGGIVSLMWHFNVPVNAATTPGADGSGVTYKPEETTFVPSNALMEGTWEHEWFYGQMDKVVDIILQLQDRGIAALWRPFHEAAGNATALRPAFWTRAWFWWGADGPDVCKALWKAMFEHFAARGVRNLVWIWTTQHDNGDPASFALDTDWYPGDDCVDMVGRDLYGGTAAQQASEFAEIQALYPHKMVALAECGNTDTAATPSFPDSWDAGARWSYFLAWNGSCMPSDAWWKDAFAQEYVVTRDQVPADLLK